MGQVDIDYSTQNDDRRHVPYNNVVNLQEKKRNGHGLE